MRPDPYRRRAGGIRRIAFSALTAFLLLPFRAAAADLERGHRLLEESCARCHAVEASGASPLKAAPPLRTLHERYPLESLEEALAEGIISGHPQMPEASFAPDEIDDILAYLRSLDGG
jgi:mono/diheme cytochrome c family protein